MATLKVLTFNVWGVRYGVASRVRERLTHTAEELKSYDIVTLQEVWSKKDYAYLVTQLESSLQHSYYFHTGIIGSGLCIFSRYPIISAFGHQFTVTGGLREIRTGEIFAGKAVLGCRIKTPQGNVGFYTTHLNPRCRDSQIFELYQFVKATHANEPVIVTGDFNTSRHKHISFDLLTKCLGLQDAFEDSPHMLTCDLASNIYTKKGSRPKRIDFILFSDEASPQASMVLRDKKLSLTGHIPGKDFPYSDHEGVEATFVLEQRENALGVEESVLDDEAVEVFVGVAKNISQRKAMFETSHHKLVATEVILLIIFLICALVLGSLITGMLVGCGVFYAFCQHSNLQLARAMGANLAQIETILKYNRMQRGLGNGAASHDFVV